MAWEELSRDADRENARSRDKLIGVYIGILAVVLAVCSLGGSNADQDATQQSIAASNAWAFFQAKNDRRQALRLHSDEFEVMLKATPRCRTTSRSDRGKNRRLQKSRQKT